MDQNEKNEKRVTKILEKNGFTPFSIPFDEYHLLKPISRLKKSFISGRRDGYFVDVITHWIWAYKDNPDRKFYHVREGKDYMLETRLEFERQVDKIDVVAIDASLAAILDGERDKVGFLPGNKSIDLFYKCGTLQELDKVLANSVDRLRSTVQIAVHVRGEYLPKKQQ